MIETVTNPSSARTASLAVTVACLLLLLSFAACPQRLASSDTVTHPLTAWSLLEGRRGYVAAEDLMVGAWPEPPQIYMLEAQSGDYVTGYGFGVATILLPVYAALRTLGVPPQTILGNRTSQALAMLSMVVAVALVHATARRFTSPPIAAFAAVAMALGSPVLSLLSRELWQQTALTFAFALACWLVFRPGRELPAGLLLLAGAIVGWTVAVRPTAAVYCFLWIWAVWRVARARARR